MFKNAFVYRIVQWEQPSPTDLSERLAAGRFVECGATQQESAGWVEPRGNKDGVLAESVGGRLILKLCSESKAVPGSVVKTKLEDRLELIEAQTGRRPKGKQAKEIKEEIVHDLLPRAFPKRSTTLVWIDVQAQSVVVDASSAKKADGIVSRLVEVLGGGIVLRHLETEISASTAMATWLQTQQAPSGFTIDRDCELKQPDSEKASVRYARHTLEIDEVGEHIKQGKVPTQLALTWASRVSFVLSESLSIKMVKMLDVVVDSAAASATKEDGGFDADVAIVTGELSGLIPDLIDALGGELDREQRAANAAAAPALKIAA
jgi:recombination associated protein RdgC